MQNLVSHFNGIVLTFPFLNLLMNQGIQFRKLLLDDICELKSELKPFHLAAKKWSLSLTPTDRLALPERTD